MIVGVNLDPNIEDANNEVSKFNLNWRSFFAGEQNIGKQFGQGTTRLMPIILLIDEHGIIQFDNAGKRVGELGQKIEELVTAVEAAAK